jgi:hypothetical protein
MAMWIMLQGAAGYRKACHRLAAAEILTITIKLIIINHK